MKFDPKKITITVAGVELKRYDPQPSEWTFWGSAELGDFVFNHVGFKQKPNRTLELSVTTPRGTSTCCVVQTDDWTQTVLAYRTAALALKRFYDNKDNHIQTLTLEIR